PGDLRVDLVEDPEGPHLPPRDLDILEIHDPPARLNFHPAALPAPEAREGDPAAAATDRERPRQPRRRLDLDGVRPAPHVPQPPLAPHPDLAVPVGPDHVGG